MQELEERIRRVEPGTPISTYIIPPHTWVRILSKQSSGPAHSVLTHLEDYRNGNEKGRATVGMTELEGITREAPGCCVTPEKDDRHISNVTCSQTAHQVPKTLMGDLRGVCSRLWTVHNWPGNLTGIQNPESLQFCHCSFLPHFLQLLHFPSRSRGLSCKQLHCAESLGTEEALVCFHSILWGFRSRDNLRVLPALEHGRHVAYS